MAYMSVIWLMISSPATDSTVSVGICLHVCLYVASSYVTSGSRARRRQVTCLGECILSSWHRRQTQLCLW